MAVVSGVARGRASGRSSAGLGRLAGRVVDVAGVVTGRVLAALPSVPGLAGAGAVAVCAGEVTGHVFGHGLAPWVGGLVGGVFLLLLDRRL